MDVVGVAVFAALAWGAAVFGWFLVQFMASNEADSVAAYNRLFLAGLGLGILAFIATVRGDV